MSTQIEHDATLNTLKALQSQGYEVTLVAPEMDGSVSAEAIRAALRPDTAVVSLMAVCNETGAVLPLREAKAAGVGVKAYSCKVEWDALWIDREIPVIL